MGKSGGKNLSRKKDQTKHIIRRIKSTISSKIKKISNLKKKLLKKKSNKKDQILPKQFEVITPDGVDIKLNFYDTPNTDKGIILLPMLGKTKESMDGLAQFVCKLGYKAIAVDYRGHGGSELNWQSFRSKDFANMFYDVKAAKEFFVAHKTKSIGIIGVSIGANVALNYMATDPSIKTAILISPGIDYRGVKIDYAIPEIKVPIFIFTSKGDQ
ncbi:MAG: alpha/beta hydrolase, partial [Candidatus Micrarchaeota archaeon]|nr:alpha/beta hydrolase [Candidatus Micrarchaeota archaeon]